jgi:hypothetical protein
MAKQKRTSKEAVAVVREALDLAQSLMNLSQNPEGFSWKYRASRRKLMRILLHQHLLLQDIIVDSYKLVESISKWAEEYQPKEEK